LREIVELKLFFFHKEDFGFSFGYQEEKLNCLFFFSFGSFLGSPIYALCFIEHTVRDDEKLKRS